MRDKVLFEFVEWDPLSGPAPPEALIGREAIIYPNVTWRGILPGRMIVKNKSVQEIVMRR